MTIVIDPTFSVYHLVERSHEQAMLRHRKTMSLVSYEIENASIVDRASTRVFSGFQRLSKFLPQVERYRKLAEVAESVYVFGIDDIMPPAIPNVTYVPLRREDQLSKEWFLVSYGRDYFSALATEELTSIDDPDDERMFRGLWTFEERLVSILHDWLSRAVDADTYTIQHEIEEAGGHNMTNQMQLVANAMQRMVALTDKLENQAERERKLREELVATLNKEVQPTLSQTNFMPPSMV
jgi:hypothetical protein